MATRWRQNIARLGHRVEMKGSSSLGELGGNKNLPKYININEN
jgi:hypothetical protein